MDEVRRSARSVRVHLHIPTGTVKPADFVSLQIGAGRPPLIAAPHRPQGNKFRGALEDLSDATFERWVVNKMPVSQPKTHNELTRVPVPDNFCNGCGRTSCWLTYLAGLHDVILACASRHPSRCNQQTAVTSHFSQSEITGPAAKCGQTHEPSHLDVPAAQVGTANQLGMDHGHPSRGISRRRGCRFVSASSR